MNVKKYDRIVCNGEKGTILFIGEVPPTCDIWYGVDWDNEKRGKHNGSHNGIKYFNSRTDLSGSFVRPSKVSFGVSLEDGIKGRYQDDHTIEDDLTDQLQKSIKARFVQVVGMEKIGKQQSEIHKLETVVLDGWPIQGPGSTSLSSIFPQIKDIDLSNTLLSSWDDVANICHQLKKLKIINISGNRLLLPSDPTSLIESFRGISHLIMNAMFGYSWQDIIQCAAMFPNIKILQIAYNKLEKLSPISQEFEYLEHLDIGANPFADSAEILHLGVLKRLNNLNLDGCLLTCIKFPETPPAEKTSLFPALSILNITNNPLDIWQTVGELDKVASLKELNLTHDENKPGADDYVLEHTFARIRSLQIFNRTKVTSREKKDNQMFYLRSFSAEFYQNGGSEDLPKINLTVQFMEKHPTYLALVNTLGAPSNEGDLVSQRSKSIRDLKITINLVAPNNDSFQPFSKTFLPTIRISKVKMMLKRQLALDPNSCLKLSYLPKMEENKKSFEIDMDNDMHNLQFYSIHHEDTILVRW